MSTEPTIGGTVQSGDFTITSSHETPEQMTAELGNDTKVETTDDGNGEPDLSKAASELGKKGGEAAAAKRAAEAKEAAKAEKAAKAKPETEEADEAAPDERTDEEKKLGKPRHDPKARMLEATRKEAAAKREAEAARQELARERQERARLQAELEQARTGKQPEERPQPRQVAPDEPKEEDYDDYKEYLRAVARHEVHQEQRKAAEARREQERHQRISEHITRFSESMTKAAKADPEFASRVAPEVMDLQPTITLDGSRPPDARNYIADEFLASPEDAPTLVLHLSEHPEDLQRIAALRSRREVTRELARIVTRLEKSTDAATTDNSSEPTVSKARPPVKPVTGAPPIAGEPDPDTSSFDDHLAYYNARDRAKRR